MNLTPDRLEQALSQGLAPMYVIAGEEPLLVTESADAVRAAAKAQGYTDRRVLHAEGGFDWSELRAAGRAMSLFAEKTLIELHLPTGSPGRDGGAAIKDAAQALPPDTLILIICAELDSRSRNSAWFKAVDKVGVTVFGWTPKGRDLHRWLGARLRQERIEAEPDAVALLAERVEGNLLAGAQDIAKLALLHPGRRIDVELMADAVADHARFAVFDLIDKALAGPPEAALRTLDRLREEGLEPFPIVAILAAELRKLARVVNAHDAEAVCAQIGVFRRRIPLMVQAARRHSPASVRWMLSLAGRADRGAKGVDKHDPWGDLLTLVWVLAAGRDARGWMAAAAARLEPLNA